jgi:hypothetical protein
VGPCRRKLTGFVTVCVKGFGEKCWDAADKKVLRSIALACVR